MPIDHFCLASNKINVFNKLNADFGDTDGKSKRDV